MVSFLHCLIAFGDFIPTCLPSFLGMEKRRKSRWEEGRGYREEKGRVEIEEKGEGG